MADTPALPGEAPDPSAASALDALLRRLDELAPFHFVALAPRLAAIVRVLREAGKVARAALTEPNPTAGVLLGASEVMRHALARAEAIAKGD